MQQNYIIRRISAKRDTILTVKMPTDCSPNVVGLGNNPKVFVNANNELHLFTPL